jgi:CRISPR-associated exonuclease Cas4
MFSEDDLLPLSGLQHFSFCQRRWALVHIEMIWADNLFTAEGSLLHERAHSGEVESRPGVLVRRTLPIHSFRLGLSGQADIVEFQPVKGAGAGITLDGRQGLWRPYPIEYKRKRTRAGQSAYEVQLCGQAMCLEEMLGTTIPDGAIYDGTAKRRKPVFFTTELRRAVEYAASRMHELSRSGVTPPPVLTKGCDSCSLLERCQPRALSRTRSVRDYLDSAMSSES